MISVTILIKNGQRYLHELLSSLSQFNDVVLLDTGSTDKTLEIAAQFSNVTVYHSEFSGFGACHNKLSNLAKHDWILSIDADEIPTPGLINEILSLQLDDTCVYSISRKNFYRGKWIKGCGWYPDRVVRLYNKRKTCFSDAKVHESILADSFKKIALKEPLKHFPYNSIADFLAKMQSYSTLFAEQYRGKREASLARALFHGLFAFVKSYILKRGIFLGSEGFIISCYNAHTAYYKYLKLQEANKNKGKI